MTRDPFLINDTNQIAGVLWLVAFWSSGLAPLVNRRRSACAPRASIPS